MPDKTVAELRKELRQAEEREHQDAKARKLVVPIKYRFTILPATESHTKVYDPACRLYAIHGEVVNREEALAAGHYDESMRGGGMVYVYNTLTRAIVCSTGGGTIWISDAWYPKDLDGADDRAFDEVNRFLEAYPEGGDITDIVERFRASRRK
jgi:hypothetical protein